MTNEERVENLQRIITQYRTHLASYLQVGPKFDPTKLPPNIQNVLKLVTSDEPKFSNIAAIAVVNYSISHLIGQTRAAISDPIYSRDIILTNVYNMVVSNSGSGKSSSTNKLNSTLTPALELILTLRKEAKAERAKELAYNELKQDNPNLSIDTITEADYAIYMEPLPRTTVNASSTTRGGMSRLMAKLQQEQFGTISTIYDELAMSIKSGPTTEEILQLLTEMFDMGKSEAPEFKHDDNKEVSIDGIYPNLLAHTSPTMLFGDQSIRDKLSTLFSTSFARRAFYSHPDDDEAAENNPIAESIEDDRHFTQTRKELARKLAAEVSIHAVTITQRLLNSPANRTVKFSTEANELYLDYFSYCAKQAELLPDSSILQIEMNGRTWRLGKLAAIWALYEGTNVITKDILAATIYYAEYNAKYLEKFVRLTTSRPFELMAAEFIKGKTKYITLHDAIAKGFITKQTPGFKDILDPINSYLRLNGTVSYDPELKAFCYEKLNFIEDPEVEPDEPEDTVPTAPQADPQRCHYAMSYTILPQGTAKEDRIEYLANFTKYRNDLCPTNLVNLLTKDSVYNTFQYKDAPDKHGTIVTMNRNRDNIVSKTNLIVLDVDKTTISMEDMHEYMNEIPHILSSTSDPDNNMKYRILLPINVELDGSNHKQYSYVVRRLAADLLITVDKVSYNPAHPYYGYANSKVLENNHGRLYDITKYLTEFAKDELVQDKPPVASSFKTEKGRSNHVNSILDNASRVFSYAIEARHGEGSLMLARACLHMITEGFTSDEMEMAIKFINSQWSSPMPDQRLYATLLDNYMPQCRDKLPK